MLKQVKLPIFLVISLFALNGIIFSCGIDSVDWNGMRFSFFIDGLASVEDMPPNFLKGLREDDFRGQKETEAVFDRQKNDIVKEWQDFITDEQLKSDIRNILYPESNGLSREKGSFTVKASQMLDYNKYKEYLSKDGNIYVKEYLDFVSWQRVQDLINDYSQWTTITLQTDDIVATPVENNAVKKFFTMISKQKPAQTPAAVTVTAATAEEIRTAEQLEERAFNKNVPAFIKRKFAYQAVKAYYRNEKYAKAVEIFEKKFGNKKQGDIAGVFAKEYYGRSLLALGFKTRALGALLDTMDEYYAFNVDGMFNRFMFRNFNSADFQAYAASTTDNHKKANALFYESGGMSAAELVSVEPESRRTMLVVLKNCMLMYPVWYGAKGSTDSKKTAQYMRDAAKKIETAMVTVLDKDVKVYDKALWNLMAAYMAIIAGDNDKATGLIKKAGDSIRNNKKLAIQAEVMKTLAAFAAEDKFSPALQEKIVNVVKIISADAGKGTERNAVTYAVAQSLEQLAACRFIETGDKYRAGMCFMEAGNYEAGYYLEGRGGLGAFIIDHYSTPDELIKSRENPQPIDKLYDNSIFYDKEDIYYIAAMKYLRQQDYANAFKIAAKIKDAYWNDVFDFSSKAKEFKNGDWDEAYRQRINRVENGRKNYNGGFRELEIKSAFVGGDSATAEPKGAVESKKIIMNKLYTLWKSATGRNAEEAAKAYYEMGNLYFSSDIMTYSDILWSGGMWYTLQYSIGDNIWFIESLLPKNERVKIIGDFYKEYNHFKIAGKYFGMAQKLSKNKELKAKSFIMEEQSYRTNSFDPVYDCINAALPAKHTSSEYSAVSSRCWDEVLTRQYSALRMFKKLYETTDFYKDYYDRCSWLREAALSPSK